MTDQTFEFKSGLTVILCRVNPIFVGRVAAAAQDKWESENEAPKCPTYEIEIAGGGTEVNELTEDTIGLEPWVDDLELQDQWEAYQTAKNKLALTRINATTKAYAVRGVVEDPPTEWLEDQAYWDLDVPDDPRDVKWEWLQDCATGDWYELLELIAAIQSLPNETEVAARAAEESFRDSMGAPDEGADAGGDPEAAEESEA